MAALLLGRVVVQSPAHMLQRKGRHHMLLLPLLLQLLMVTRCLRGAAQLEAVLLLGVMLQLAGMVCAHCLLLFSHAFPVPLLLLLLLLLPARLLLLLLPPLLLAWALLQAFAALYLLLLLLSVLQQLLLLLD